MPVFLMFFFWAFGTGGLWLVRPLFGYQLGGTFLLVALISSISAAPRLVTGPVTGYLADRFGRRPFVVIGSILHIIAMGLDFFVQDYIYFFLLEIVGGIGIAVWMTSANALMADATTTESRGRAVAVREVSVRTGLLVGPLVSGLIAGTLGLRYVFLFIAATKVVVIVVTVLWMRELRQPRAPKPVQAGPRRGRRLPDLTMFRNRDFVALGVATIGFGLVVGGTGVFRTLFPVQTEIVAGLSKVQIGNLIAIAGFFALAGSLPAGFVADRWGRKWLLFTGLLLTGVATYLMSGTTGFMSALVAVIVFGVAEAIGTGTLQVYAMDLAPVDRRGAYLGVWSLYTNVGQITGPLLIGGLADLFSFRTAFVTVAVILSVSALLLAMLGKETAKREEENMRAPPS